MVNKMVPGNSGTGAMLNKTMLSAQKIVSRNAIYLEVINN